jgi:hypothetical protein
MTQSTAHEINEELRLNEIEHTIKELSIKIKGLEEFTLSDKFNTNIELEDRILLLEQFHAMKHYNSILEQRIDRFK